MTYYNQEKLWWIIAAAMFIITIMFTLLGFTLHAIVLATCTVILSIIDIIQYIQNRGNNE